VFESMKARSSTPHGTGACSKWCKSQKVSIPDPSRGCQQAGEHARQGVAPGSGVEARECAVPSRSDGVPIPISSRPPRRSTACRVGSQRPPSPIV